jgi:hypothetical protein
MSRGKTSWHRRAASEFTKELRQGEVPRLLWAPHHEKGAHVVVEAFGNPGFAREVELLMPYAGT